NKTPTHGMTDMERVALYGYTTGDYDPLNKAMRNDKGSPTDSGLAAYAKHTNNAMKKLPEYKPGPAESTTLKLTIFTDTGWGQSAFVQGKTYSDHAFASTKHDDPGSGAWKLTINGTKNTRDIGPYSAWPLEKEILTLPGAKYTVGKVVGNQVELTPQ